jgi:type VI secretion system secreted protein Hcp
MDYQISKIYSVKPVPGGEAGVRGASITMNVKGQKQGDIDGGAPKTVKGAEKAFQLIYFQQAIISPRDPASGLPTGQRLHMGLEVVGKNSKGVPGLWQALTTNELLNPVKISFWSQHGQGAGVTQKVYYTIELENANIATMDHMTSEEDGTLFFRARLTYDKIVWTHLEGNLTAADHWESAK